MQDQQFGIQAVNIQLEARRDSGYGPFSMSLLYPVFTCLSCIVVVCVFFSESKQIISHCYSFEVVLSPSGFLVDLSLKQSFREHRYRLGDSESCMMSNQTPVSSSTAIACISSSTQQNRKAGTVLSVSCGMASHDHVLPPGGGGLQCSSLAVHCCAQAACSVLDINHH